MRTGRFYFPTRFALPTAGKPQTDATGVSKTFYIESDVRENIDHLRTGEYAGMIDLEDFYRCAAPIVTVPRPR